MPTDIPTPRWDLPKINPGYIKIAGAAVIIIILFFGTVYQISPEEIGVIQRFGRYVRTADPGLHFKLPLGIERLTKVPVQRQLKMEFGFRTVKPGINTEYRVTPETLEESVMLTGDLNVAVVEWIVQYKIKDAYKYLFKMRNADETFRDMNEAVVRNLVGNHSVDEILTVGRVAIANGAKEELQKMCDRYEIGIGINQLLFQDINPPDLVKPSFNEVNQALQEKERKINEAWSEYNQEIPKASGEAEQTIRGAEGYATERINNSQGDASRFRAVYAEYAKAPLVTRRRLFLEAINDVLPKIQKKIIIDQQQKNMIPLLNLGEEVKK
ncbi:MAG: FtsH protease activity modulator HflK [Candidatus Aminicenantes bacterium]|nr:FtsH protease activity modulator HflK [Candidatus Aminicenantes bacterium]